VTDFIVIRQRVPLHLRVDSTCMKVEGQGERNARKHGGRKRRVWRKVHIPGIWAHVLAFIQYGRNLWPSCAERLLSFDKPDLPPTKRASQTEILFS
jgi:hypothetical protein